MDGKQRKTAREFAEELIVFVARDQAKPYDTVVRITPKNLEHVEHALLAYALSEVRETARPLVGVLEKAKSRLNDVDVALCAGNPAVANEVWKHAMSEIEQALTAHRALEGSGS